MYLEIKISVEGNSLIGYDYYKKMHGYVSKLLGNSNYGTSKCDYVYSNLFNVVYTSKGIRLRQGKSFFIVRTKDNTTFQTLAKNYEHMKGEEMFYGVTMAGVSFNVIEKEEKKFYKTCLQSPILIGSDNLKYKDWLDDKDLKLCETYLVNNIKRKALDYGLILNDDLTITIKNQNKHSDVRYNGAYHKGRVFDLTINANSETKEFILLHGLGLSCGSGFGFIY